MRPIRVTRCRRREVTVKVVASVVSCGTERARFLGLPNASVEFPHEPGYAAAGVVIDVGAEVSGLAVDDRVALLDVPHQSVATVPIERVYRVAEGVALEDAALLQLGIIAAQGVRRAAIQQGEPFAVIGMGLIGSLAHRIARLGGAGPCTAITATRAKAGRARESGVEQFIALEEDAAAVEQLARPVVIDATGDPEGLALAVKVAKSGGRVILLGSPRGLASCFPVTEIWRKHLQIIGAHVNGLKHEPLPPKQAIRREAELVLQALASNRLVVSDLFTTEVDPREAERFYRRLTRDRGIIGARFDWSRLPQEMAGNGHPTTYVQGSDKPRHAITADSRSSPFASARGHLRFAIIGCGEIAVTNAEAIALAPNATLAACHDVNPALAEDLAQRHGAVAAPSIEAVLERPDVDAVMLCLPHHLHAPAAIQAAEAGKHVVVEKPMAIDLESAIRMVRASERSGVVMSVCFPERYKAAVKIIGRWLSDHAIGEFGGLDVRWFADKPASYYHSGLTGRSPSGWRMRLDQAGGGVLLMNLVHDVDLARHLTRARVKEVMAFSGNLECAAEVEDSISVSVRYEGGAVGSFLGSSASRGLREESMRIWGTDGQIEMKPAVRLYTLRALHGIPTGEWITSDEIPELPIRAIYVSRFVSAVAGEHEPDITVLDGLAVQAFVEAAYRSTRAGRSVRPADLLKDAGMVPEGVL